MDVTIGTDTKNLWLFGSTGNFTRISSTGNPNGDMMENILYGIRDVHFPHFKHLNSSSLPLSSDNNFVKMAAEAASKAFNIDSNDTRTLPGIDPTCINTTDDAPGSCKIKSSDLAWVIYLDKPDGLPLKEKDGGPTKNRFRKASASPTVFKGQVYFPIYEPDKEDLCGLGKAFICSAEDECGTNSSHKISGTGSIPEGDDCYYVKRGILSKLVVGTPTTLFANVAGPSESEETLISILSDSTDFSTYRRSWRENY
jgi:type IV pilus assembly protein PilY1